MSPQREQFGFGKRSRFSLKALIIATTILSLYFASLPQFIQGKGFPLAHLVTSCFAGALFVRSLGFRDPPAIGVGGAIGSALGVGIPSFFLFMFPQKQGFTLWGGYGFVLDALAWLSVTILALAVGGAFGIVMGIIAAIGEGISK